MIYVLYRDTEVLLRLYGVAMGGQRAPHVLRNHVLGD